MADASDIAALMIAQVQRSDIPCAASTNIELDDPAHIILDDFPSAVAIGLPELDAIERYLSDILDVVLGSCAANATTEPKPPQERIR